MSNLNLKNKILLILILPLIAILILSSISIYDKIEKESKMSKTASYIDFTIHVSDFLTALQKEREISIIYLNSYGKENKVELENQAKITNDNLNKLKIFIKDFELINDDNNLLKKVEKFEENIKNINQIEKEILNLKISLKDLLTFYDNNCTSLISFFDDLLIYSNSKDLSKSSQAYLSLINIIEKSYSEKNIVKNIFEYNSLSNTHYNSFISLIASENSYLEIFEKNLLDSQLEFYKKELNSESFSKVEAFREIILLKMKKDSYLAEIKESLGFGGLIHSFKDFMLNPQDNYLNKIQKNHTRISRAIKDYKKLENLDKEEIALLLDIESIIDSYMSKAYEGLSVNNTKELDEKGLEALNKLSKNIYGGNVSKWEEESTKRLVSFEKIKEKIVEDMITDIKTNVSSLDKQVILFTQLSHIDSNKFKN